MQQEMMKQCEMRRVHERLSSIASERQKNEAIIEENRQRMLRVQFGEFFRDRVASSNHDLGKELSCEIEPNEQEEMHSKACHAYDEDNSRSNEEEIERVLQIKHSGIPSGPRLWRSILGFGGRGELSVQEIKRAKGELVLKTHPDKNKAEIANLAAEALRTVIEAYENLAAN